MKKQILWIEDESFMIKGLLRPMEKLGFKIDIASSALAGYQKSQKWINYDILVVDLIIPLSGERETTIPQTVKNWANESYVGIGLSKWLSTELQVSIPILLLSVVQDPLVIYGLKDFGLKYYLTKSGLLPTRLKEEIMQIITRETK